MRFRIDIPANLTLPPDKSAVFSSPRYSSPRFVSFWIQFPLALLELLTPRFSTGSLFSFPLILLGIFITLLLLATLDALIQPSVFRFRVTVELPQRLLLVAPVALLH
jgi:hypothetical protein